MRPLSDRFSFDSAKTALFRLESILKQHGIAIAKGSLLEAAWYDTLRIVAVVAPHVLPLFGPSNPQVSARSGAA